MGRRLVTAGVAAALGAGALVGASSTAADAADTTKTGTSTYTCTFPIIGAQQVPVDMTIPNISAGFPEIPAGLPLSQGSLNASYVFHAGPDVAGLLPAVSNLGASDMTILLGSKAVKVAEFAFGTPTPVEGGGVDLPATGTNSDFSVPGGGVYDLTMPKSFVLSGTSALGDVSVPCTTSADPAVLDTLTVVKNDSTTTVTAPAKVKKGKVAKIVTKVAGGVSDFRGKVVIKDGKKKLGTAALNDAGKAVFKAKGLKVGKHKITAKWAGDAYRNASKSKAVVVKVVK
ncbi:Ig-like domain repeat protein [Nocardioides sp. MAHUQ-72]|uniref:Ig-like domain-containing protein n=1 Tax=unclassified Nocardioides TaxID=2615069 RepID=UPI0036121345